MTDELRLARVIDATPDVVFEALTSKGGEEAFHGTDDSRSLKLATRDTVLLARHPETCATMRFCRRTFANFLPGGALSAEIAAARSGRGGVVSRGTGFV
jgi:hypothetical protein